MKIDGMDTKLLQFADDTIVVLSDLNSAKVLFKLLDDFEKVSGLKLNVEKLRQCGSHPTLNVKTHRLASSGKNVLNFWGSSKGTLSRD